jgi:quercetin dioxygenase-like cupin family protein
MGNKKATLITALLFFSFTLTAQVQVSKEPRHKNVLENKYVRLLNVKLQPGDTTLFHIHSTPSVFVHFTNTVVCSQIKGKEWATAKNSEGNASYRSFVNDTLVHRVSNCDTVPFHVTDVELLSSFDINTKKTPLPFPLLFENEKVFAYRLTKNNFTTDAISNRGPMIAELVAGDMVYYFDIVTQQEKEIKAGGYLYIEPGASFSFSFKGNEKPNMVLFEIK